ncbi:hypothetical protein ACFFX1_11885 [Dactylosporangium sucinum]|uniref:DUF2637 domain-containing protein n=1 Tax=Dactylosporangium sucinum TaxID=1424081 RepID=A0A917TLI7_9ACTN|nr:hypothetical protein [Dactylosporangium sucinum]GGM27665.1 hypothetical protein GCM10007977_031130 [Dactylosporangium sucinum]
MTTNHTTARPAAKRGTERLTDGILVVIVLLVGVMAGAASFTHVHDWTIDNSPADTADWIGWANAVITELIPTAALIVIARRRKTGASIGYPMFLLVVAVGFSLTAQLAVAVPTVFGWLVSALPALAFFALSKLVFSVSKPSHEPLAPAPDTIAPAPSIHDTAPATVLPVASPPTAALTTPDVPEHTSTDSTEATPGAVQPPQHDTSPQTAPATTPALPARPIEEPDVRDLLPGARVIATAHRQATGEPITQNQLAVRMKVPTTVARDLLTYLTDQPAITHAHNGAPVTANH